MKSLVLKNAFAPGDIVMMSAALRDLHRCHPGQFRTDVRTPCPDLWLNNPYLTRLREDDPEVETIDCDYPLINRCDRTPYHCLHGFIEFLNDRLDLRIRPTEFKGDIHLSARERAWFSQVHELTGEDTPFWIMVAGGKFDATIKWWDTRRFQEVVDHFRGRIQFVQVGDAGHHHPRLDGVIDLRGRTNLRQLVRLVHHAQGIVCPVTLTMHLAAAVEVKVGQPRHRPCVVIAGGREPPHWEAYPGHQFLHTLGALPCCATEGCWRARTVPLGDGDERDHPDRLCVSVVRDLPRCMDLISASEVIRRIELYFDGGVVRYLSEPQAKAAWRGIGAAPRNPVDDAPLNPCSARREMDRFLKSIPEYPGNERSRGIVLRGGGAKWFPASWVTIQFLRRLGCTLPIQIWYRGDREFSEPMKTLMEGLGVECVDARKVRQRHFARILGERQLALYATLYSPFKEVLYLDAGSVPVLNPALLFETEAFRSTGVVFWRDEDGPRPKDPIWTLFGISPAGDLPIDARQVLIDKERAWKPLNLAMGYCEHADFLGRYLRDDGAMYQVAFARLNYPLTPCPPPAQRLIGATCQLDFQGNRVFQHRTMDTWNLFLTNKSIEGFWFETECFEEVRKLRLAWDGRLSEIRSWIEGGSSAPIQRLEVNGAPRFVAVMASCPERDEVRERTLENLKRTDWVDQPVLVEMDVGHSGNPVARLVRTAFAALSRAARTGADFALYLEDDLEFNRFLHGNLRAWMPVRRGEVTLASLYNPGIPPLACDVPNHCFVADPATMYGSQAFLISLSTVNHLLRHWHEEPAPLDFRMADLAGRLRRPILYHAPSLVQHVGTTSVWGGTWHEASDFDPDWRAGDAQGGQADQHGARFQG